MQAAQSESWDTKYIPTFIEFLLHERLGSAWMDTARDMLRSAATLPTHEIIPCGPFEIVHWRSMRTILLRDPAKDLTRFMIYDELLEPEAVLELDGSQAKHQFIVVYRASDKYPEPGSLLQTR